MLIVRGVCLEASVPMLLPNMRWPLRFRASSLVKARVPLFIDTGKGKLSTSFEATLTPKRGYCGFSVEMPEGDDEALEIADYIAGGFDGVELTADLLRKFPSWSDTEQLHTDVIEYSPLSLALSKWAPCASCWCWVEEGDMVKYEMPPGAAALFFAIHEDLVNEEPEYVTDDDENEEDYAPSNDDEDQGLVWESDL